MAIDNQFGKGIGVAAGFDLGAQKPLDSRLAVNTIAERDAHVTENRAFEGMIVFVDETKKNYQLVNGEWVELFLDEQNRLAALESQLNGGEGAEGNGVLAQLQDAIDDVNARLNDNGDIDNRIAQNASDIDALEKELADEIGVPSVPADENGEGAVSATGMHKVVEDSAAELRGEIQVAIGSADTAVAGEKSRAEGQEALIRQEFAAADKALKEALQKEIDDDVAAESALRVAEEERIEDKVDQEVQDRKDAVQGVQNQIDAINNADNGILAQAKAHAEAKDLEDRNAQALVDQAQDDRIKALEDANDEGGAIANAIKAVQDAADAAQADVDAVEKRLDDEGGLVDRLEVVEQFVEAHDDTARDARIKALEDANAEGGAVANAIKAAHDAADAAQEAAEAAQADVDALEERLDNEGGLVDRIEANEAFVAAQPAIDQEQDRRIKALEDANAEGGVIKEAIDAAQADVDALEQRLDAEGGLVDRIEANEANIARLDGAVDVEGSVKKQIKDAIDAVNGAAEDLEERVKANEDAIGVINGEGEGSIKKAVADLVDGAPEALDTLNELAAALRDNADVLTAIETAFDGKLATLQADVDQNEADCDAAIKAEKEAREAKEAEVAQATAAEQARVNKKIADDIAAESALRVAEEQRIEAKLDKAKTDLQAEIDADVKVVADDLANQKNAEIDGSLANLIADEVARAQGAEGDLQTAINNEKQAREQADNALDGRLDAVEASLGMGEGNEGTEGIASRVEDLEIAVGKPAVPGSDEDPDGEAATGLYGVIDAKIAEVNGEVNNALNGLEANVTAEKERAETEEARIEGLVGAEKTRAEAAEKALSDRLNAHLTTEAYDGDKEYTDLAVLGGTPEN